MQHPGTCRAPTYLRGVTQGEQVPAECLSRSVIIMYKSKYIHGGLYLSRSEKKAAFSSYSSPALYNRQCKHLNSELGAQTVLHLSVSKGVIQRKRESRSSATSSSNVMTSSPIVQMGLPSGRLGLSI